LFCDCNKCFFISEVDDIYEVYYLFVFSNAVKIITLDRDMSEYEKIWVKYIVQTFVHLLVLFCELIYKNFVNIAD